jgi:hypothetical protein
MKIKIIFLAILLLVTSCAILKDYHFGDVTRGAVSRIEQLNTQYCAEQNATMRNFLLTIIHMEFPLYPSEGICGFRKIITDWDKYETK